MIKKFGLVILIILLFGSIVYLYDKPILDERHYRCISLVEEGTIYGGQPFCEQGPVLYYYLFGLKHVFGDFLPHAIIFSTIALNLLIYGLLVGLLKREINLKSITYIIIAILQILMITIPTYGKIEMLICTFMFLFGFGLFFYHKMSFTSSLFFAVAILSKFTVLPLIVGLYIYTIFIQNMKFNLKKEDDKYKIENFVLHGKTAFKDFYRVLISVCSILVLLSIAKIIIPNVYTYSILAHLEGTAKLGFWQSVLIMFNFIQIPNVSYAMFFLLVIFLVGMFLVTRNVYYFLGMFLYVLTFMFIRGSHNAGGINIVIPKALYYFSPVYALILIGFVIAINSSVFKKKYLSVLLAFFIVFIIWFPGYFISPINELFYQDIEKTYRSEQQKVQDIMRNFLNEIPEQELILLDGPDSYVERYNYKGRKYDYISEDIQHDGIQIDPTYGPTLIKLLDSQYREWKDQVLFENLKLKNIRDRYLNGEYSLIIISPPMLLPVKRITEINTNIINSYCRVDIPESSYFTKLGQHHMELYFKNHSHCDIVKEKLSTYYSNNIEEIRDVSPFFVNVTQTILNNQNISLDFGKSYERYDYVNGSRFRKDMNNILFMILLSVVVGISLYYKLQNK